MANWTAREQQLIDGATEIAEAVRHADAPRWNSTNASTRHYLKLAANKGLMGIQVPITWGGSQASFQCKAAIAEILAGADFGFSMSLINTQNIAVVLSQWMTQPTGSEAQALLAARIIPSLLNADKTGCTALTEPHAGSDFAAINTLAVGQGDGWTISGEKAWIINAQFTDFVVMYAQTQPGSGAAGIAAFLIDAHRAGFERDLNFGSEASASLGTSGFKLNGYIATKEEMIHPAGLAFKRALESINAARTYVAAMCCGMVADCLRVAVDYGSKRTAFGVMLAEHQGWRWRIAEAAVDLEAARQLVQAASKAIDENQPVVELAAKAKVFAVRMAEKHTAALLHSMGANGLKDEYPFVRHMVGAQIAGFTDGSTEMMLERICKSELPAKR
ncbi:butyryl-CoA dehydrogenase/acyl-CoA dehydrogenase [Jezberella montanilacus]|jgi:alkylation response protein AidB-like acyl-CoA dehydrogenase|uniref:Butyryl-CoA dehydrogenase/acyl-CoA dehydrogenase n=1 Tax=Jezberella montanilacus TaxID=323426 RepID=A0A2T0XK56_9BURK|nr:acyl-CoA dehydrogenase family protein [Jezberella montanilacus]PRY99291.1 butyryl-CoA dehydrogenase/acyl-CoA dehydrogenase [Jezberella montanilacus]